MRKRERQGKAAELREHALGLIPIPDGAVLTPSAAREWLSEWAAEYARAIAHASPECRTKAQRNAYGMLGCDLAHRLKACALAISHDAPVHLDCSLFADDEREVRNRCAHLAEICGSRPDGIHGAFENVYDECARQIATLLAREAA